MCGRYQLTPPADWEEAYDVAEPPEVVPRFNIAPTQPVIAVRPRRTGGREAAWLRWGLVPSWADDPSLGARAINARAETLATRPAFRDAFRSRRCLIPATGFYEWRRTGKVRQPYLIGLGGTPFAFAGLWDRWSGPGGPVESCTIVTTDANAQVAPLHDRMPVLLDRADYERWLDPAARPADLSSLLRPWRGELLVQPVSTRINDVENDDPDSARVVDPPPPEPTQGTLFGGS